MTIKTEMEELTEKEQKDNNLALLPPFVYTTFLKKSKGKKKL